MPIAVLIIERKNTMLNFRKITKADYTEIIPFLEEQGFCTCDYTELGLFMWVDYFRYEYAIDNGVLYIRSNLQDDGQNIEYLLPLAIDNNKICGGIELIIDHEKRKNQDKVCFCVVPEQYLTCFDDYKPLDTIISRDWSDYTYPVENLAGLLGKKYNKKRNLIHQFRSLYPNFVYADIDDTNIQNVIEFHRNNRVFEDDSPLANYENSQVQYVLDNYNLFHLRGGTLSVDNNIVAFCIGEIIKDCLYIHIEKANREYKGAFQMMNQSYASAQYNANQSIKTINREEDVGDDGLRQAKMSYFPSLINKYNVVLSTTIAPQD